MDSENYEAVRSFPRNEWGRDYVVGDIHGCFRQLQRRLERLAFDPSRDRLFSVGDLLDRGPDSLATLRWLQYPWFHCCLGNHEAMLLSLAGDWRAHPDWFLFNGGQWWFELEDAQRAQVLEALLPLPFALEVATAWGQVAIVHADVSADLDWPAFVGALRQGDPHARATALWSRSRADGLVARGVAGIDRVVCGHTIDPGRGVSVHGNVWFIDTGAFLDPDGESLTVLPMAELFTRSRGRLGGGESG